MYCYLCCMCVCCENVGCEGDGNAGVVVVRLSVHVHFNLGLSPQEIAEFPDSIIRSAP